MKVPPKNKLSLTQFRPLVLLAIVLCATSGCAGIKPARVAPQASGQPVLQADVSVRVMDVTGSKKSPLFGAGMIDNDQFKQALLLALQRAGVFREVGSNHGDVDLYATIQSEGRKDSGMLQYTATMIVTYKFADRAGNVVWSETYESESSSTTFFARAREGSARENLASLIRGIRERWPKK